MSNQPPQEDLQRLWPIALAIAVLALAVFILVPGETPGQSPVQISYTQFKSFLREGHVEQMSLRGDEIEGRLSTVVPGAERAAKRGFSSHVPEFGDPELLPMIEERGVELNVAPRQDTGVMALLALLLPWVIIIGVWIYIMRRMMGGRMGGRMGGFGGGRDVTDYLSGSSKKEEKAGKRVTFADVAGQDNAKREVAELVEYLRDPAKYRALGAEAPHGVLLMGPPGTGKTLLARALAGEAEVAYFHISASEFIELFVGVGASRVRHMFAEAKKRAPCIIFIDELDSVGRVRGTGFGGGSDEREQTLNQILAEMDGFSEREAVIVLAATNRPDVLDPALLRPGRFDRHVTLELPDLDARVKVLQVHTLKVPLAPDVDLKQVAAGTPGFSGADLKNLVNEAAMAAAREAKRVVESHHFDEMRDRILMGTVRTMAIQDEERHRLAVHEAGHTAAAYYLPNADRPYKVTIIPRGRALGSTQQLPEEDRHTLTQDYLCDRLAVMLAGRAAEKALLGSISSGADDDIRTATQLARAMAARWGMSEEVGPVDVRESDEHPFLGREMAQPRNVSEATAQAVDAAVRRLLTEAEQRAETLLTSHRVALECLVASLEHDEMLDGAAIDRCLAPMNPPEQQVSVTTTSA
ncbi:MAG: ATP-dependent zinc metalloprotease FtsH [bacterium]